MQASKGLYDFFRFAIHAIFMSNIEIHCSGSLRKMTKVMAMIVTVVQLTMVQSTSNMNEVKRPKWKIRATAK